MEKSKVYYTDFRTRIGYNLLQKLENVPKEWKSVSLIVNLMSKTKNTGQMSFRIIY